jgi:hypothetical protein
MLPQILVEAEVAATSALVVMVDLELLFFRFLPQATLA